MNEKPKVCLVSCSVLKEEIQQLVKQGDLDAELVFVSKYFHIDYAALENNLHKVLEQTLKRFKGKSLEADPEHNLMFMGPGMIGFFKHAKEQMRREGVDDATFASMFSGIKGLVLLNTCGNADRMREELEQSGINVQILETREIGLEGVKRVILDAIEQASIIN